MDWVEIGRNCKIRRAIIDKDGAPCKIGLYTHELHRFHVLQQRAGFRARKRSRNNDYSSRARFENRLQFAQFALRIIVSDRK